MLVLCFLLAGARAQDQPIATLSLAARVVNVPTLVRDHAGQIVTTLGKEDFVLKEDGKEQEIRYFSQDSTLPLTIALLIDTSGSQRTFIGPEISASEKFIQLMLVRPEDRAALVQFDTAVLHLSAVTHNVDMLENGLGFLTLNHPASRTNLNGGGTLLYDAISGTSSQTLGKEPGRRAMVVLTDGEDNGSQHTLEHAIAEAQTADVIVYSIFYSVQEGFGSGGRGRAVLDQISKATGGRVFTVSGSETLKVIYAEIADELRQQYQIGYRPGESAKGTFHKIELKAKDKKLKVQARSGYYTR